MAVQLYEITHLDPNGYTGPTRMMSGVAKTGNVILNSYYGENGTIEFARWIYCGGAGNIFYTKWDGTEQDLVGLTAGVWHPIFSIRVNSAGTTATNIVWGS